VERKKRKKGGKRSFSIDVAEKTSDSRATNRFNFGSAQDAERKRGEVWEKEKKKSSTSSFKEKRDETGDSGICAWRRKLSHYRKLLGAPCNKGGSSHRRKRSFQRREGGKKDIGLLSEDQEEKRKEREKACE